MSAATAAPQPMPSLRGRNREVWVGLFVLVGLVAVLVTLFTLTDPSTFRGRYTVYAEVPSASGIRRGDPVQLRGVNIGRIKGFHLHGEKVRLRLDIDNQYRVPADSHVQLRGVGLLGEMVAEVQPGQSPQRAASGAVLPGVIAGAPFSAVQNVADEATDTLEQVRKLLSDETIGNVRSGSESLDSALQELAATAAEQREQLAQLTASLRRSARGLEGAVSGPELERSVKRLDETTVRLEELSASLMRSSKSAETVLARIERGEGSLGLLVNDRSLYENAAAAIAGLNRAAEQITQLTADIRREPGRYFNMRVF